jgi:peptide deformylase
VDRLVAVVLGESAVGLAAGMVGEPQGVQVAGIDVDDLRLSKKRP